VSQTAKVAVFVTAVALAAYLLWGGKGIYALLPFPEAHKGALG
jgi:hypothetical protein